MAPKYRQDLPQLTEDRLFVTDGGLETDLIFNRGIDLPEFAAFVLIDDAEGRSALREYYESYHAIARELDAGLVLDTPTWRANRDWGARLGYDRERLAAANRGWMEMIEGLREEWQHDQPVVLDGMLGPRGDGYVPGAMMSSEEAEAYHSEQIATFADTAADMVCVLTINYVEEAIGIARAAAAHQMPAVISFTVETDGRLPTGQALRDAVEQVDHESGGSPAYFMVNCAHPTHFAHIFEDGGAWQSRVRGIRANASKMSHEELDAAEELDAGDPHELAEDYERLHAVLPALRVLGGCCGTDHRHVGAVCSRVAAA